MLWPRRDRTNGLYFGSSKWLVWVCDVQHLALPRFVQRSSGILPCLHVRCSAPDSSLLCNVGKCMQQTSSVTLRYAPQLLLQSAPQLLQSTGSQPRRVASLNAPSSSTRLALQSSPEEFDRFGKKSSFLLFRSGDSRSENKSCLADRKPSRTCFPKPRWTPEIQSSLLCCWCSNSCASRVMSQVRGLGLVQYSF